jgi:hypothetical protein
MSGYETECFILNEEGEIDNSDILLKKAKAAKLPAKKECVKGMIEMICMPNTKLSSTSIGLIKNLITLTDIAEKDGFSLFPFASYPGQNDPVLRKSSWYEAQKKILGESHFRKAGLCCGFHQHYALPRGIYSDKRKFLEYKINSKVKRTFLDSYNLLNAADPILTLFLQSSPYVNNWFFAKDSRMLLYRGGKKLRYEQGVYSKRQFFGGLSPYKQTLRDLISTIRRRHNTWRRLMFLSGFDPEKFDKNNDALKFAWNPVKVNSKGTLEYRGGDMNYLSVILAVSTMIKFVLRKIQQDFLLVVPLDMELKDAFRIENNVLFIPPHSQVRKELQPASAYEGFNNDRLYTYASAFFRFAKKYIYKDYRKMIAPVKKMIDSKESVSDTIIKKVKQGGYGENIPPEFAKEMALFYSAKFKKDLIRTQDMMAKIEE